MTSSPTPQTPARTPDEIEKDLTATRQRFTGTLNEISVRVQPEQLGQDLTDVASSAAEDAVSRAKTWAGLDEDSDGIRPELIGALVGAGLAIAILVLRRRHSTVTYEFMLPNDNVALEEVLVRATGHRVPSEIGGQAV